MSNLNDVAREAEVSIATVSRVINNSHVVNVATRTKVQDAIKKLDFHPNRVGRRLAKLKVKEGESKIIGLVLPDISNPFFVDVLKGVEDFAYDNEYAVITCNFAQDQRRGKLYLDILQSESIDGLLVAPVHGGDAKVAQLVKSGLPIVCIDRGLLEMKVDLVLANNHKGAFEAVSHFVKLGHKRIAFISGLMENPTSAERLNGYKSALQASKIRFDAALVKYGNSMYESGYVLTEELLKAAEPPTAIFTGNNLITLGALGKIHQLGLNIPKDIAIIGFDDMYWSVSLNPPLTAVKQPGYDMGRYAVELLLHRIKDPTRLPVKVVFDTELKIRKSCGTV